MGNMIRREIVEFNDNWRFLKLPKKTGLSAMTVESPVFDDSQWESVTLPHTWNAVDGADGRSGIDEGGEHYYRGVGGYRKRYVFSGDTYGDKRIFLEFEGANTVAELYVNGYYVGVHEGGYSTFRFDISWYVRLDKENLITVKVSNAPTTYIAPITDQGDFTKMGGIYRDVRLIAVPLVHIDLRDYGSSGIYVTLKNIAEDSADLSIIVGIENNGDTQENATVSVVIKDQEGDAVADGSREMQIPDGYMMEAGFELHVANPVLWNGRENPHLYVAEVKVETPGGFDCYSQPFGIRTYRIDPEEGFFLNGKYLDLRGVNYHQDSYENGWAMTADQRERDYGMMLDMGCTTVRMAHYQHDGYEYDLCDRLGLTVWTEIGIVNKMSADETDSLQLDGRFAENARQQLTELIRQNYNHPSIIVWGISNELYQMSDEIFHLYEELCTLARTEDETRLITFADNQGWGRFLEMPVDVMGYNRYNGWYKDAGAAEQFGEWVDSRRAGNGSAGNGNEENNTMPVCISEYGGGGAISQHKDNIKWPDEIDPWGERHFENYQSVLHETIWPQFAERRFLWAKYIWCMFDFASDGREEGDTKGQNDKGLVTRERVPKDAFYFYKSVWSHEPMLHLTEKRFVLRPCLIPRVKAYSNAERVELFVNGVSMGITSPRNTAIGASTVFVWDNVELEKDVENEIMIRAFLPDGGVMEDKALWIGI